MTTERRSYAGNAVETTITTSITGADTSILLSDSTGWPTGANGPFFAEIDWEVPGKLEKIKCSSRTGLTLFVVTTPTLGRGVDGTNATTHSSNAAIRHVWTAIDANDANKHYADTSTDDHPQYLNNLRHDTDTRHIAGTVIPVAAPTPSGPGDSNAVGVSNSLARADHRHQRTDAYGLTAALSTSTPGDTASQGSSTALARVDHRHARVDAYSTTATASAIGDTTAAGTSSTLSRGDHKHARETIGFSAAHAVEAEDNTHISTLSTSYVNLNPYVNGVLVGPSGLVLVHIRGAVYQAAANPASAFMSFLVFNTLTTAVILAASDSFSVSCQGQDALRAGITKLCSITPGTFITVICAYRTNDAANAAHFQDRGVIVVPL